MGRQHLANASYLGIFSSRCLATLQSCYLHWYVFSPSKIAICFGHYLLCLTEGHPKRTPWPQRAPLSQTLIGESFHHVLKRNSPDTARWQKFQRSIIRCSCENELPCSARDWSQLVTPRTPKTHFSCDYVRAIIAAGKCHVLKWSYSD